jgi:uncharacterized membrane protein
MAAATAITITSENIRVRLEKLVYPLALLATLSLWLLAIRAPLWLDETLAYWQISGGFTKIWSRSAQMPSSFTYLYILWFAKSILGSSEIALRVPSMLAMLGAAYTLFRSARELFNEEIAYISCILFSIHLFVIFAANDARPYAFALLITNLAILAFIRWINRHETRYAIQFGVAAAGIFYFHYLFGIAIVPAFVIGYLALRRRSLRVDLSQVALACLAFALICMPQIPRFIQLFRTRELHVFAGPPEGLLYLLALVMLAPMKLFIAFSAAISVAALARKVNLLGFNRLPGGLLSLILAVIPAAVLYVLSVATSTEVSHPRYWLVAVPGSTLLWGWFFSWIDSRPIRQVFCVGLIGVTLYLYFYSPSTRRHEISFKQIYEFVNLNVANDDVPVLMSSGFIESSFQKMPPPPESALVSQLSYYPVHTQVTLLPIVLNDEAIRVTRQFATAAGERHQRFLMVVVPESYPTLEWLVSYSSGVFAGRTLANFDRVLVVEFVPVRD